MHDFPKSGLGMHIFGFNPVHLISLIYQLRLSLKFSMYTVHVHAIEMHMAISALLFLQISLLRINKDEAAPKIFSWLMAAAPTIKFGS